MLGNPVLQRPDIFDDMMENPYPEGSEIIDIGYLPRPLQAELHESFRRFNVCVCHRRFGKTVLAIAEMVARGVENLLHNPQFAYIAPTYGQAKRVAWEYLKDFTKKFPNRKVNEADLRIDIIRPDRGDHIRFMLLGADNPDSLRGIYLDGTVLDEFAQCDPSLWGQVIRPALSDRKGWAVFIGTPKGQNHFFKVYEDAKRLMHEGNTNWYCKIFKASETGVVDADELIEAKATMSEEEYNQEYECDFTAALLGSYYGKIITQLEKKGNINMNVNHDPSYAVSTYWDLGIGDATAVWFVQTVGNEIRIIDYLENTGVGLDWYAREIKNKPYSYDRHGIPHDGAARELGTGKTRQETLIDLGLRTNVIPRQSIADGINASRVILKKNIKFHAELCSRGLDCLKSYQRKYDSKNQIFLDKPLHNWASNGADAFRMLALDLDLPENGVRLNIDSIQIQSEYNELGD